MKENIKKRMIAFICIICMVSSVFLNVAPATAEASDSEDVTMLEEARKNELKDFTKWTFSNAEIEPGTLSSDVHMGDDHASYIIGDSLDKTLFSGKINFPETSDVGTFYIGGASDSKWRGFLFRADGTDRIKLHFAGTSGAFYNANGNVGTTDNLANAVAVFDSTTAGTDLRGNSNLQVSFSVEYVETTDTTTTLKVGVFFDGKLYNNTYYTVKDVPLACLKQTIRFSAPKGIVIDSYYTTLQSARENELKGFTKWTFSNVEIDPGTLSSDVHMGNDHASYIIGDSLDKTLFSGKINFPETSDVGTFYIGGASDSKWRGFLFRADGTDRIKLHFAGTSGAFYNANGNVGTTDNLANAVAVFDSTTAGTDLRGNSNLQVSFSVEYVETTDTTTTLKVGVFFDGKLYNNTYYTVKDVPLACLKQTIRFSAPKGIVIDSYYLPSLITLDTAPEKEFAYWTFSNVGIESGTLSSSVHMGDDHASYIIGNSLNKTLFSGKINFPETSGIGTFYIGGASDSKWRGFMFRENGTEGLKLHFAGPDVFYNASGTVTGDTVANAVAVFDSKTAGTTLRGNSNLQVSFSVEYTETTDTTATLKVGVFFDGNLYNDTYFTVKDVPLEYLKQTIRFSAPSGIAIASAEVIDTIVQPEITDSIAMNYITTIDTRFAGTDAPTIEFTMGDKSTDAIVGTLQDGSSNTYVFTYPNIMAQNIADTITATVTVGKYTKTYNYSVLDYCVDVLKAETLNGYTSEQMAELKNLIVDLVQYGAEVQKYRNASISDSDLLTTKLREKVSNYVTYDKTDDASLDELSGVVETKLSGTASETYEWTGVNLVLGNKAKIRGKFTANASDVSNLTVKATIGNEEFVCEINGEDGAYYVDFDNIYAYEYAKEIQIKFYNGETPVGQTLLYSVNTYLKAKKNVTELQALLLAINSFGDAATNYNTSLSAAN